MKKRITTREMTLCALFTVLTAVGAFIKVPVPVVPFTLQLLFTMMAGLLLGGRLGALSVGIYAVLGLAGLPVFAEGGGFWYILKPSFGYILGFIAGSYVTGRMVEGLERLTEAGIIDSPEVWKARFGETVTVGQMFGILGKLLTEVESSTD